MGDVRYLLPRLTVNRRFIRAFLDAPAPCFALGLVEEHQRPCGFLAIRPDELIPASSADAGFQFGHTLFGTAAFEVVHFAFSFYDFKTYNVLVNPSNPLVRTVLTTMVESGDYYFFALSPQGEAVAFRSAIGQTSMAGLETNLPRIQRSTTTDAQYRTAVKAFERRPEPPGTLLSWVCRENSDAVDLVNDRFDLAPQQT